MKFLNFLLIFLLVTIFRLPLFSQPLFHKKYLEPGYFGQFVQQDNAGNFYVATTNSEDKLFVMRCDSSGTPVWGKLIGQNATRNFVSDFIIDDNQNLVITFTADGGAAGNYFAGLIISLDTLGTVLYSKVLGNDDEIYIPHKIIRDTAGFTMSAELVDTLHNYGFKLIKFDNNADIIFERHFHLFGNGTRVLKLADGSYILHQDGRIGILYIDPSFTQLTYREGDNGIGNPYPNSKAVISSDSLLYHFCSNISNSFEIACTDIGMTNGWFKDFLLDVPPNDFTINDILELSDKSWYLVGSLGISFLQTDKVIIHADSTFSQFNAIRIPGYVYDMTRYSRSVITENDELVFVANGVDSMARPLNDFEVIKTDTTFSSICNAIPLTIQNIGSGVLSFYNFSYSSQILPSVMDTIVLGVADYLPVSGYCYDSTLSVKDFFSDFDASVTVYPTPASDKFTIRADRPVTSCTITDITGRVYQVQTHPSAIFEVSIRDLPNGAFFLLLKDEKGLSAHKMLIKGS